jgi:hypothetical protein
MPWCFISIEEEWVMTKQQKTALRNPCYLSEEVLNPAFRRKVGLFMWVISVNNGFE